MMEKQNRTIEKTARGDSGVLDDIVDFATGHMGRSNSPSASKGGRNFKSDDEKAESAEAGI